VITTNIIQFVINYTGPQKKWSVLECVD